MYKEFTEKFRQRMEVELIANTQRKGDFRDWKPERFEEVLHEVDHHLSKLDLALRVGNKAQISEYAADIGNFMAKIDDLYGE